MHRAHVSQSYRATKGLQRRLQSVGFANVVTGGERVRRVHAHTQRKFRTCIHNRAQMLKAVADALSLSRSVIEQNAQPAKLQTLAGELKTKRANLDRVRLVRTTRTTWMEHQVIDPQQDGALGLFSERGDRFQEDHLIGGGQIDEIIRVNQNR